MSLLSVSCRACRSTLGGSLSHSGPSCSFATSSTVRQGTPLPSRDWGRLPRAGPSSNDNGRPAPRPPQRRMPSDHQSGGQGSGSGSGNRKVRGPKIGWNGNTTKPSGFGLRNRAPEGQPQEKKEDLTAHLKSWNLSAQSRPEPVDESDRILQPTERGFARSPISEGEDDGDRTDRRARFGDKGVRESRGFEASRRTSGDGEFVINRNTRQGSKKGKERESDHHRSPLSIDTKRPVKPKKGAEKIRAVEKEVYIPSTVTVSRLADIFGVKICMFNPWSHEQQTDIG